MQSFERLPDMRLDRSITLNLVGPIRCLIGASNSGASNVTRRRQIPILMYHSISDESEPGVHPYYRTNTSPSRFREQIQFLAENGYRTLDLTDAVNRLKSQSQKTVDRPHASDVNQLAPAIHDVVITFDDGFESFYTEAFPVLRDFGFSATVFLPTGLIRNDNRRAVEKGKDSSANRASPGRLSAYNLKNPFLTWNQVTMLHKAGTRFGSHSVNHPRLVELGWADIEFEVIKSKLEIEQRLSESVTTFAYPFAFPQNETAFVNRFKALLEQAGYKCNVTTEIGCAETGQDPYRLKRLPVNSCDDLRLFRSKLEGGYNWLGMPQKVLKSLKRLRERS
jgi:peptidoglycan/xylan/chitin deacetylase (PgdA/CDA1 family)